MPKPELFLSTSSLLLLLAAVAAVGLSVLAYRHTIPSIPSGRKYLLITLRSLSLFLLLLLLLEPILRLVRHEEKPPTVSILVDDSKSMAVADNLGSRSDLTRRLLKSETINELSRLSNTKFFRFSGNMKELAAPDSLRFEGASTDISSALRTLRNRVEEENIRAVVLISDGNYNLGENPLREAGRYGIPIYAIGIGDSSEQKDLLISKAVTNEIAYAESQVPMDVTVKSSGFHGERVEVTLSEGGKPIAQQFITLKEGTWEYPVKFTYEPKGEGTKRYTVSVPKLAGEVTGANNTKSVFVKVLKSKMKVLLLAGAPSVDAAFVRRALSDDKNIEVKALIQKTAAGFYESDFSPSMITDAECIVLVGFPISNSRDDVLRALQTAIVQQRKPTFTIVSRTIDAAKLRVLDPALPFVVARQRSDEMTVYVQLSAKGQTHPVMTVAGSPRVWDALPPIYKTGTTFQQKAESDVLAVAKLRDMTLEEPLIVSRSIAGTKSLAVLGYGIWRWKLLTGTTDPANDVLQSFIANGVRWLTTREEEKQVKISATKEVYTGGEAVEFVGQVYDKTYKPIDGAEVKIVARKENETYETLLSPLGNGRYEGKFEGLSEGEYQFTGTVTENSQRLGEERGKFSVGGLEVEFQETKMNKALLQQLAHESGGKYFDPEQTSDLPNDLRSSGVLTPKEITHSREFELLGLPSLVIVIVLLFGTEWFLRKQSGLL
jgi:hypothetical protein